MRISLTCAKAVAGARNAKRLTASNERRETKLISSSYAPPSAPYGLRRSPDAGLTYGLLQGSGKRYPRQNVSFILSMRSLLVLFRKINQQARYRGNICLFRPIRGFNVIIHQIG